MATRARPRMRVTLRASESVRIPASTALAPISTPAVSRAVRQEGRGTCSRDADVARVRSCGFGSASSTTKSRSEEHTSELQSLMRISYAVFCLKKHKISNHLPLINNYNNHYTQ